MRNSSHLIIFLLLIIPRTAFSQFTLPFFEDFSESDCDIQPPQPGCTGPLPAGWISPFSDVPGTQTSDPNDTITWRGGEVGYQGHAIGNDPPAAYFYYTPNYFNYDFLFKSPTIYVGAAEQVQVLSLIHI